MALYGREMTPAERIDLEVDQHLEQRERGVFGRINDGTAR
jgi:hypothetical protein